MHGHARSTISAPRLSDSIAPPRAVIDSDVIFSRVLHDLFGRLATGPRLFTLIWSEELLAEARSALVRRKPVSVEVADRWVGYLSSSFPEERVDLARDDLAAAASPATTDPDDAHVCALAIAGRAELLITADPGLPRRRAPARRGNGPHARCNPHQHPRSTRGSGARSPRCASRGVGRRTTGRGASGRHQTRRRGHVRGADTRIAGHLSALRPVPDVRTRLWALHWLTVVVAFASTRRLISGLLAAASLAGKFFHVRTSDVFASRRLLAG